MARGGCGFVPAAGGEELKDCSETCFIAGMMCSLLFVFTDPFPGISTRSMECFFLNKVVCALQKCREGLWVPLLSLKCLRPFVCAVSGISVRAAEMGVTGQARLKFATSIC